MDRLTVDGTVWQLVKSEHFGCNKVCEQYDVVGCTKCPIQEAMFQLTAYENTGLLPEEIETMKKENRGLKANSMIQEHIIESGGNPFDKDKIVKLIMENSALKSENARLTAKAEELESENKAIFDTGIDHQSAIEENYKAVIDRLTAELQTASKQLHEGIEKERKAVAERDLATSNMEYISVTRNICAVCRCRCKENRVHCAKFTWIGFERSEAK